MILISPTNSRILKSKINFYVGKTVGGRSTKVSKVFSTYFSALHTCISILVAGIFRTSGFTISIKIFKGSVVKITLKHGLKPGIFLRKRFGRFLWFFRSVIYNPSRKKSRLDFSCKSLYLIVFVHLKNLATFWIFTGPQETVYA